MKKIVGKFLLFISAWKLESKIPLESLNKGLIVCAPHTSNWDFYYCIATLWQLNFPFRFFIKDYYTRSIFGFFFKYLGAIGVDRTQKKNLVDYTIEILQNNNIFIINTPEGSRSKAEKWRTGFYYIAKQANVPILIATADYKNKKVTIVDLISDVDKKSLHEVLSIIEPNISPEMAKFPDQYNPNITEG